MIIPLLHPFWRIQQQFREVMSEVITTSWHDWSNWQKKLEKEENFAASDIHFSLFPFLLNFADHVWFNTDTKKKQNTYFPSFLLLPVYNRQITHTHTQQVSWCKRWAIITDLQSLLLILASESTTTNSAFIATINCFESRGVIKTKTTIDERRIITKATTRTVLIQPSPEVRSMIGHHPDWC